MKHKLGFLAFFVTFCFLGTVVLAANSQIPRLIKEKQQKMEILEQCAKRMTGFKIAGISTLGLTAVGIGGNIALAHQSNVLSDEVEKKKGSLEKLNAAQQPVEKKYLNMEETGQKGCDASSDKFWYDGKCIDPAEGAFEYAKTKENCDKAKGFWVEGSCLPPVVQNAYNEQDCKDAGGWWHKSDGCVLPSIHEAVNLEECEQVGGLWDKEKGCIDKK